MSRSYRKTAPPGFYWRKPDHLSPIRLTGEVNRHLLHRMKNRRNLPPHCDISNNEFLAWLLFKHKHRLFTYQSQGEAAWTREQDRCADQTKRKNAIRWEIQDWQDELVENEKERQREIDSYQSDLDYYSRYGYDDPEDRYTYSESQDDTPEDEGSDCGYEPVFYEHEYPPDYDALPPWCDSSGRFQP